MDRLLDFQSFPPAANALGFALAATVVWWAGLRLTRYAKTISDRLGGRPAFIGLLLLGGIASLPEAATALSASLLGNAALAVNTLLGGIAITLVIVALVDGLVGWEPLSTDITHPILLLQASLVILLLCVAAAGIVVGDIPLFGAGVGVWTSLLLLLYIASLLLTRRYEKSDPWVPLQKRSAKPAEKNPPPGKPPAAERHLAWRCAGTAAAIVAAGFVLASAGDALAQSTGLGDSFVGMVLGGIGTSLPELTTTLAAVRMRQYEMAFADAFGTNLFSVMLLFFADLAFRGEPLLALAGPFSLFAILLGIALTAVYLAGLIERRNYAILRMGVDSFLVLLLYLAGLIVLFQLR